MKLLFDENLSRSLVARVSDQFPDSRHVFEAGLGRATDEAVREFAKNAGLTIVSKDSDFNQRAFLYGPPPTVVWPRVGNCTTAAAESVLRRRRAEIEEFSRERAASALVLE